MHGLDALDSTSIGITGAEGYGALFSAAGGIGTGLIDLFQADSDKAKAKGEATNNLTAMNSADAMLAQAKALSIVAADAGKGAKPGGPLAKQAAMNVSQALTTTQAAEANVDAAAAKLTDETTAARLSNIASKLSDANKVAASSPTAQNKALAQAWGLVLQKAQNKSFNVTSASVGGDAPQPAAGNKGGKGGDEGLLDKKLVGPVKVKHAAGAALLGAVGLVLMRRSS